MITPPYTLTEGSGPLVAVALHDGHAVRPEVASALAVSDEQRLREEDPFTGTWTRIAPNRVLVHRSRFEVDLNRPRSSAVYRTVEDSWGIDVWGDALTEGIVQRSLYIYDAFYRDVRQLVAGVCDRHGGALIYDLHSYNHRRGGPDAEPAPALDNPLINVGTGPLNRDLWGGVVDAFIQSLGSARLDGEPLDVRENVRFKGGHFSRWASSTFPGRVCVLAIEVKKVFMDEWTGQPDPDAVEQVGGALAASVERVMGPFRAAIGRSGVHDGG